ncbi:MAG: DUF4824 family protein [Janthinobacterium lividum]
MKRTPRIAFVAGIVLIVVVNLVIFSMVAYNRSGEPDSILTITGRELGQMPSQRLRDVDSGLVARLQWRVLPLAGASDPVNGSAPGTGQRYSQPAWLNDKKLAELGFNLGAAAPLATDSMRRKATRKDVFLVLEMNGPAYRQSVDAAMRAAAEPAATGDAAGKDASQGRRFDESRRELEEERHQASRLFIVDAGLDPAALRARYPDRGHHAILTGRIRAYPNARQLAAGGATLAREGSKDASIDALIEALDADAINIPKEVRRSWLSQEPGAAIRLAFGKRLEPWVIGPGQ